MFICSYVYFFWSVCWCLFCLLFFYVSFLWKCPFECITFVYIGLIWTWIVVADTVYIICGSLFSFKDFIFIKLRHWKQSWLCVSCRFCAMQMILLRISEHVTVRRFISRSTILIPWPFCSYLCISVCAFVYLPLPLSLYLIHRVSKYWWYDKYCNRSQQ